MARKKAERSGLDLGRSDQAVPDLNKALVSILLTGKSFEEQMSNEEDNLPKLRMAPSPSVGELTERIGREHRASQLARESNLENSLTPFRVGSVPYFNAVPLTRGLEEEIIFVPPVDLAEKLRRGELDAALVSITETLFNNVYDILDGIAVASLGEVFSVFLAHKKPIEEIDVVFCDPASLTSVNLLKVLLAEQGRVPRLEPLQGPAQEAENVLLIGNAAIEFRRSGPEHQIWDLGAAWYDLTRLPFVYAVWALTRSKDTKPLRRQLREAKDFGLDTLDYLIENRTEYDRAFRKDYLGWHIHYHLGADEKRGVARFVELLRKHSGRPVYEPMYVS
jgi:chorismate dehydratase